MARIPDEEIERLKRETDLAELVHRRGVKLTRHGKDLIGLCPLHDDHEPSLVVTPSKNLWHCLGACRTGGSAIDWVMKTEGVSFRHAVAILREGAVPAGPVEPVKKSTVTKLPSPVDETAEDAETLRQVVAYYHETLLASPDAIEYLESRGIADPDAIERFQLGFADRSLGLRIPAKNRKGGAVVRERLQRLGILRESGHEHFNGSIVFPIINRGEILGIYGRKIRDDLRAGTAYHLYLPGPHRGIWNLEAFAESKELILCESIIDALTFWCAGFHNVTTSYGINGFTTEMLEALKACGIRRVLIAYDADAAGDKAAAALAKTLLAEGIGVARIHFLRGLDANEYARKVGPPQKALAVAINSAEWLGGVTSGERRAASGEVEARAERREASEKPEPASSLAAGSETSEKQLKKEPIESAPPSSLDSRPSPPDAPLEVSFGERRWRIRGIEKNLSYEQMKVTVRVTCGERFFVDSLDLVSARHRGQFLRQAAAELELKEEIVQRDLGQIHLKLEEIQERVIREALDPKPQTPAMTADEESEALALLRNPKLVTRILADFARCGVVGEETNKLMGYLGAVSRKLDEPLAILIQSSSAAGKSALMDAVLALMPEEERVQYSAMTGQSLFYMGETDLKHKILAIAEEEGAERASYALKLLQSEGELTIASTGKDPTTGRLVTHEYRVEGPVMIFLTTTAIEIDEELLNRCIVLTVDEDREQTRAIHELQRRAQTIEGLLEKEEGEAVVRLHRNAQRLLRPVHVANELARGLTFLDSRTRTRRDHMKYLTLIRAIALLHQYQRPTRRVSRNGRTLEYIEVTAGDVALANQLAHDVLGRSLDELAPQTRRMLEAVTALVDAEAARREIDPREVRFTQRDIRESSGWPDYQVKLHMRKLVEMEYLLVHRGGRGQSFVYELLYRGEGSDGRPFLMGLAEPGVHDYDPDRDSSKGNRDNGKARRDTSGTPREHPRDSGGTVAAEAPNASPEAALMFPKPEKSEKPRRGLKRKTPLVAASSRRSSTPATRGGNGRAER